MEKYELRKPSRVEFGDDFDSFLEHLLRNRGITSRGDAEIFLSPDYEAHTHDPLLLKDAEKAAKRIIKAIKKKERTVIFSDFDTDGIPAAVILGDFFKKVGYENFSVYIPHRNDEGFGLNLAAIEKFGEEGADLIITLDCGIRGVKEVARASELGIETIITDHHLPGEELPKAYAIVNPKQKDCPYPFKDLCGAAVGFKLAEALIALGEFDVPKGWEKWLLDMVGIATISDMVPLVGENRVLAHYGLLVLRKSPRPGIGELLKSAFNKQRFLSEEDVGFTIGPRINAASRMDTPDIAYNLLSSRDQAEAVQLASELNGLNNERKGHVASIVKAVKKKLKSQTMDTPVVVTGDPDWKPSLLGLAASSIADETGKPVFLWGRAGGKIKGSCRSNGVVNLALLMNAVPEGVFEEFGGHAFSGGFVLSKSGVHTLRETLSSVYDSLGSGESEVEKNIIDAEISLDDINKDLFRTLQSLAPFGVGNPKPLFLFREAVPHEVASFGKTNNHLKLLFKKKNGEAVEAISFFKNPESFSASLKEGIPINLLANIEEAHFNGRKLRLRIVDIV